MFNCLNGALGVRMYYDVGGFVASDHLKHGCQFRKIGSWLFGASQRWLCVVRAVPSKPKRIGCLANAIHVIHFETAVSPDVNGILLDTDCRARILELIAGS